MAQGVRNADPFRHICDEHLLRQISRQRANLLPNGLVVLKLALADAGVDRRLYVLIRLAASDQGVQDDADRPDIASIVVQ